MQHGKLSKMISPERAKKAKLDAEKEILQIRLAELRKQQGIRQKDIKTFSQSSISKIESRKDMKISTLLEYLKNIDMGIEIKAIPKNKQKTKNMFY